MNLNPEEQRKQLLAIRQSLACLTPMEVLVIDDCGEDAVWVRDKLGPHNIGVSFAPDVDTAILLLTITKFAVIFMDWKLIGKSGLEALADLKAKSQAVVIVLTGLASDDEAALALEHGAAAVMSKPLTDEQVKLIFDAP